MTEWDNQGSDGMTTRSVFGCPILAVAIVTIDAVQRFSFWPKGNNVEYKCLNAFCEEKQIISNEDL